MTQGPVPSRALVAVALALSLVAVVLALLAGPPAVVVYRSF